jgi:hypothetical protein
MKAKAPLQTLAEYDEALVKDMKLPVASTRPVNSGADGYGIDSGRRKFLLELVGILQSASC